MKKAFSLIEIMLAIMILSLFFLAINSIIINLKSTKQILNKEYQKEKTQSLLIKTLYADLRNAISLKIKHNPNYDRLYLITKNSLYRLINPYVVWYVSKNKNTLIRLENPNKIKIPTYKTFFLDKFAKVKLFKIYQHKNKIFVFIKTKKPIYFEIYSNYKNNL